MGTADVGLPRRELIWVVQFLGRDHAEQLLFLLLSRLVLLLKLALIEK